MDINNLDKEEINVVLEILDKHIKNNFYDIQAKNLREKLSKPRDELSKSKDDNDTNNMSEDDKVLYDKISQSGQLAGLIGSKFDSFEFTLVSRILINAIKMDISLNNFYKSTRDVNIKDFETRYLEFLAVQTPILKRYSDQVALLKEYQKNYKEIK